MPKIAAPEMNGGGERSLDAALVKKDACYFRLEGTLQSFDTPYYARESLPLEETIAGPAIILQTDATTVIPPGSDARADASGNLFIRVGVAS